MTARKVLIVALAGLLTAAGAPRPVRPDARITPGATLPVVAAAVCRPGYAARTRDVPEAEKRRAFAAYAIPWSARSGYEVDHLISLELGGSNAPANLWPEAYDTTPWNAHVKDRLEGRLHRLVCSGTLPLATAQRAIATDWIAAYHRYVGDR